MAEVTIRDVAQEAGLSVSSVSRILRGGQGHVYPTSTHDRVREIADRLGYKANAAARLLRQTSRTLIGISAPLTEHPHINRFLVSVRNELVKCGYDPVIIDMEQLHSIGSGSSFPSPQILAGLITLGVDLEDGWPAHYALLRKSLPVVAFQTVSPEAAREVDVVHVDHKSTFRQAIRHLQELGHSRIAYLGPTQVYAPSDGAKYQGWRNAAAEAGIHPGYLISWKVPRSEEHQGMDNLMSEQIIQEAVIECATTWEKLQPRPTAVICTSDEVAICLQSYLQAKGYNLPRDLSIVGYDGISLGAFTFPALTTVAPNFLKMSEAAITLLLGHLNRDPEEERTAPQNLYVEPELILRGSTAKPRSR